MPYLMLGRNESAVYFAQAIDAEPSAAFVRECNRSRAPERPMTQFHLVLRAIVRGLAEFPRLNRFVVGGRLYERAGISIAFSAKQSMDVDAPVFARKLQFAADESLATMVDRIYEVLGAGRRGERSESDKEVDLILRLPGPFRRVIVRVGRWLDAWGVLPATMIDNDPLYSSAFVANLGSVGLDAAYHHLYEHGTTPIFVTMGRLHRAPHVRDDGSIGVREVFELKYTYDERTEDGFYCARALERVKYLLEHPREL